MVQNLTDNVLLVISDIDKLINEYIVYTESDPKYIKVMTETLGFTCKLSKIYPPTCFISKRDKFRMVSHRDFPMTSCSIVADGITVPIAAGLLWIFYNFCERLNDHVDLNILEKISYNPESGMYHFPHISEELTVKIKECKDLVNVVDFKVFETEDLSADSHLTEHLNSRSIVYGKCVAWVRNMEYSSDDTPMRSCSSDSNLFTNQQFKFLGYNEEDPISMEPFSELKGCERLKVFLSDHNHNYYQSTIEDYFNTQYANIRLLPYDRDPCLNYHSLAKLRSLGVLKYHNKRGVFSQSKQYVGNDEEWEIIKAKLKDSLQIRRFPYYTDITKVAIQNRNKETNSNIQFEQNSGFYVDIDNNEVYPPDYYQIMIILLQGKTLTLIYEYLDNDVTDADIYKALQNGFLNLYGLRYTLFDSIGSGFMKVQEEGPANEYLRAVMKKYINRDI